MGFNDWFEGTLHEDDHCCGCFNLRLGNKIIGILLIINVILNAIVLNPFALLIAYPAYYFVKVLRHDDHDARKHYAHAYKIYAKIIAVIQLIVAVILLGIAGFAFVSGGVIPGLIVLIVGELFMFLGIKLNLHFNRVVQAYPNLHGDGYEKH